MAMQLTCQPLTLLISIQKSRKNISIPVVAGPAAQDSYGSILSLFPVLPSMEGYLFAREMIDLTKT